MVFLKKYYVFHSNSEKIPVLTKFFIIKNKHFYLISFSLLFHHVDLIFSKKMLYFSDNSREESLKISLKKISQKNMSVKIGGIKIILNKFYFIYDE